MRLFDSEQVAVFGCQPLEDDDVGSVVRASKAAVEERLSPESWPAVHTATWEIKVT